MTISKCLKNLCGVLSTGEVKSKSAAAVGLIFEILRACCCAYSEFLDGGIIRQSLKYEGFHVV